jgi:hypothetical protein
METVTIRKLYRLLAMPRLSCLLNIEYREKSSQIKDVWYNEIDRQAFWRKQSSPEGNFTN